MDLEFEIEGIKVEAKIDTGFDGEIIVNKDVFDRIPYYPQRDLESVPPPWNATPLM